MKRKLLLAASGSALAAIFLAASAFVHGDEDGFAKWAAAHALPITVDSAGSDADLAAVAPALGTARIVALGEPMHGAREPLAIRNRLFRFLVERQGFTAIALESGFTESISARAFIERGEGDVETAVRTGLSRGLDYPENRELLQWMRDYNVAAAAAGRRKIRLYGLDITAGGRKSAPWLAMDSALTFLSRGDPSIAQSIRQSLGDTLSGIDAREFGSLPANAQAAFETSLDAVAKAIRKNRKSLIAHSSEDEYAWAQHNLDVARSLAKCLPITPPPKADANLWARASECRDAGMAENVQWAFRNEGRQGGLFLFAHDGHVMATKEDGRRMAKVREKPAMMGFHLRRAYGDNYYVIALVCATTGGGLLTASPLEEGSIERALAGVGMPSMFVDVRKARMNEDARAWLSVRWSIDANVSAQGLIDLRSAVDGFVFVNTLTPANPPAVKSP